MAYSKLKVLVSLLTALSNFPPYIGETAVNGSGVRLYRVIAWGTTVKLTDLLLLPDIFALITLRLLGGLEDLRRGLSSR